MSKQNNSEEQDLVRDQARVSLDRLNRFIESIEDRFEKERLIGSAADYIRLLQYRMELVERLGLNQPARVEVGWVPADWEKPQPSKAPGKPNARAKMRK